MKTLKIAIAQINTVVGDLAGNTEKILFSIDNAKAEDADFVVFPELTITGYPPEDLVLRQDFIKENVKCLNRIVSATKDVVVVVGFVDKDKKGIYNAGAVVYNKKVFYVYHKKHLPNYGVFDEKRYFAPGTENIVLKLKGFLFAVNICEDIWVDDKAVEKKVFSKAQFLINISASPFYVGKIKERRNLLSKKAKSLKIPIVYCNLIGGQDELVFDGRSIVVSKSGKVIKEAKAFEEDLLVIDLFTRSNNRSNAGLEHCSKPALERGEEVYSALVLGVRDYVKKNNFSKVALGLSGGIDSALVASIAVDALGRPNVLGISMPSQYSSQGTQDDAEKISKNLGIRLVKIPIDGVFKSYIDTLQTHFTGMATDVTEENIQARIRGNILMAFSNKFGYLVLNTGNKSETSVGYCTLYGDMAGGFAVIKDVTKELVYELAKYVNDTEKREIIPNSVFERAPSAELKPAQKDQDTLPSYDLLDEIIELYIQKQKGISDIVNLLGHKDVVEKVLRMVDMNEYKRRQSPPGIKITPRSFGKDRRMPITNRYLG